MPDSQKKSELAVFYLAGCSRARQWLHALNGSSGSGSLSSSDQCLLALVAGVACLLSVSRLPDILNLVPLLIMALVLGLKVGWLRPLAMMVTAACWATLSFSQHWHAQLPSTLEGNSIQVVGRIDNLPTVNRLRAQFNFKIERVMQTDHQSAVQLRRLAGQKIQLSCYRCPYVVLPDQRWQFTVRLKRPHGFASWGAFDFEKFLFRHQIIARGYVRTNETNGLIAQSDRSINLFRWQIRQHLIESLNHHNAGRAMIAALMIGDKSLLSQAQRSTFQSTGVSHLMAISGLHVGLVFLAVRFFLKWLLMPMAQLFNYLPRQQMLMLPALTAAFAYSALAGFAVSTQRAFIMLCVFVICRLCAREVCLSRMLLMAAALILILDPFSILDDGFWLSCGAVLIIALATQYYGELSLIRLQPLLWLGMIPLTTLFFGQISIISPIVNLLMVPLFCVVLIPLVLICLVLSQLGFDDLHRWLLEQLGLVFDVVDLGLSWAHKLPFALYYPSSNSIWLIVIAALAVLAYSMKWRIRLIVACACLVLLMANSKHRAVADVQIALLDVGQGLSMVVQTEGYVLVYDTGPVYPSGFNTADAVLLPYLRHRGIKKIDLLIVSHADNDHIGGYSALRNAMQIKKILTSRVDKIPSAEACQAGQSWQVASVHFSIISPGENTAGGSNNQSCVLSIKNDRFRALITGDIEGSVERLLVATNPTLKADFMLVPHHGSNTSSSAQFIQAVDPQLALLSAGYRNYYGHPHKLVVGRYRQHDVKLVSTVESGTILLKFNNNDWSLQPFRITKPSFWHRQIKPI